MGRTGFVFVSALAVTLVLSALLLGCSAKSGHEARKIAATVNGDKIYFDDVNEYYYAYLTPEQQAALTKADALSLVIERELLYQEAVKRGFTATAEEVNRDYKAYLSGNDISEIRLKKELASKNSSIESFKSSIGRRIAISKLLESIIPQSFVVKREEAEAVYNASTFSSQNISFEEAEERIIGLISEQRRKSAEESYISELKDKAQVLVVGVPD